MMFFLLLIISILSAMAQITDASIFPSVRSINPGVVHMRRGGLVSVDYGKKAINKEHTVVALGLVEPITTDVNLTKSTLFGAAASRFVSAEILVDKENGDRQYTVKHPSWGTRTITDEASTQYFGGILDFRYFGVSYANSSWDFKNQFRIGTVPDLVARDEQQDMTYSNFKIGTAIKIGIIRVGAYVLNQKADGDYTYTIYNPATALPGTTETDSVSRSAKGYGVGLGFTLPKLRSEVSLEKIYDNKLSIPADYLGVQFVNKPTDASRITALAEAKIAFFSVGLRFRSYKGNYVDLEDIISSNLLYDSLGAEDTRTEMSFNFSLGDSTGFSPSIYYTQSELNTNETSDVFDDGTKFKAVTKSKAYGVNLSYRF